MVTPETAVAKKKVLIVLLVPMSAQSNPKRNRKAGHQEKLLGWDVKTSK